jgi:hypothetical protein
MNDVIARTVDNAKTLILDDISAGMIPSTVASFSELHDYVDANEYLIDDSLTFDELVEVAEAASEILDKWIKAGF